MRTLLRLATLVVLAHLAAAQGTAPFDPGRDLEGFEGRNMSEFSDLYPLAAYIALAGSTLPPEEFARLRARWKDERDRVDARVATIQGDPRELYLHNQQKNLARTSYFSKIAWTEERAYPPFVLYVQRPSKEDPAYAANVGRRYGPWLQKLAQTYDALYVAPLGLQRRSDYPAYAVCILASPGDLENFLESDTNRFSDLVGAVYQPQLKLVVGCEDPFAAGASDANLRFPILHEAARAMQHVTGSSGGYRPASVWLSFGLAGYLAYHEGFTPEALDKHAIDREKLSTLVQVSQSFEKRELLLYPVLDLVQIGTFQAYWEIVKARAVGSKLDLPPWEDALSVLLAQSVVWMNFLHDAEKGKHRAPFLKYLKSAMSGAGGLDVFRVSFAGTDLARLDHDFYTWAYQEHARLFPRTGVDPKALEALFANRTPGADAAGAAEAGDAEAAMSRETATPLPVPKLSPAAVAPDADDVETLHAIELVRARSGDLDAARRGLEDLAARKPAEPTASRIARDVERVRQVALLRDGFLESLRQSGSKWTTDHQGRKLIAPVVGVKDGFVLLGENRGGVEKIPLAAVAPGEIARQADKREKQGTAEPWARSYAFLLAGDPKWDRAPKEATDALRALREDAKAWIPQLLRTGDAAIALEAISRMPMPVAAPEGAAMAEAIRKLLASGSDVVIVQKRFEALKKLAAAALEPTWVEQDPSSIVHGKYTYMGDGRVHVVYEFERPDEGEDFKKHAGYLKEWHKALKGDVRKEEESIWTVVGGAFQGEGAACYRHVLGFAAPMTVRYDLSVGSTERVEKARCSFMVGICDDGARSHILAENWNDLRIADVPSRLDKFLERKEPYKFFLDTAYHFEIRHDGTTVSTWVEGEKMQEAPCGPRKGGGLIFWFHTEAPLSITRLEIEGRLDAATRDKMRADWVNRKLAEIGFK